MYKLLKKELNILDEFWKFIEIFKFDNYKLSWISGVHGYRHALIKKIRETYSAEDFYKYEVILNKLLWNLLIKVKFNINDLRIQSHLYINIKSPWRTCSHKQYLHNEINDEKYNFRFYPKITDYDIVNKIFYTMSNRKLYDKIMNGKKSINTVKPIVYYYPYDYPFPNINLLFYNENKKETWINRINKLYFNNKTNNNINIGWRNASF